MTNICFITLKIVMRLFSQHLLVRTKLSLCVSAASTENTAPAAGNQWPGSGAQRATQVHTTNGVCPTVSMLPGTFHWDEMDFVRVSEYTLFILKPNGEVEGNEYRKGFVKARDQETTSYPLRLRHTDKR